MMNSRPTKRFKMPRGPFRGLREFLGRLFESKRFMMLVSLLVAILAWSALVSVLVGNNDSLLKKAIIEKGLAEDVEFDLFDGIQ